VALQKLEASLVYGSPFVCNHDYEGEISDFGSSVKIHGVNRPVVTPYVRNVAMAAPQILDDFEKILTITQADSFNFKVDDIDTAQMLPKLMGDAMVGAGYEMAVTADLWIASLLAAAAGTTPTDSEIPAQPVLGTIEAPVPVSVAFTADPASGESAYEFLVDLGTALTNALIPRGMDRYVIVPPWFVGVLSKDVRFIGYGGASGNTVLTDGFAGSPGQNGLAGRAAGFNVIESVHTPSGTFETPSTESPYLGPDAGEATYDTLIAGVPSATSFANQIVKGEAFRDPDSFADRVRGLHVYGAEVVWPERIASAIIAQGSPVAH